MDHMGHSIIPKKKCNSLPANMCYNGIDIETSAAIASASVNYFSESFLDNPVNVFPPYLMLFLLTMLW